MVILNLDTVNFFIAQKSKTFAARSSKMMIETNSPVNGENKMFNKIFRIKMIYCCGVRFMLLFFNVAICDWYVTVVFTFWFRINFKITPRLEKFLRLIACLKQVNLKINYISRLKLRNHKVKTPWICFSTVKKAWC